MLPESEKDHSVCCRSQYENFEMLVEGVMRALPEFLEEDSLLSMAACDETHLKCHFGECDSCKEVKCLNQLKGRDLSIEISYLQWRDYKKVDVKSTLGDACNVFYEQLKQMRRYCFITKIKLRQVKAMKANLKPDEVVLQTDFF